MEETTKHICKKCGDSFRDAHNLRRHLRRKKPCVPNTVPVIDNADANKCIFCGSVFASQYSLKRHKNTCKVAQNPIQLLQYMIERDQKRDEREQKLLEILERNGLASTTINNNNTVNIQQNNYVNVTICSFGNEDLSKLDTSKVMQLLRGQVKDFMSKMIEYIHANPEHPELHNVFYDPVRKKAIVLVPISETELSWQTRDFREVSDLLTDKIRDHVAPGNGPYFDLAMKDRDYDTSNNIINIAKHINWKTDEAVAMNQNSLTTLTKNQSFMDQVRVHELT